MKEYIERNKAIEAIDDACGELNYSAVEEYNIRVGGISDGMGTAIEIIESLPAADVRPVVFCKDCKHRGNTPDCPFCWLADKKMGDDHFCSFGEKREES